MKNRIGNQLKKHREENGFTQKEVAGFCGVSVPAMSRYENDESTPSLEVLVSLSKYYGVTLNELIGVRFKNQRQQYLVSQQEKNIIDMYYTCDDKQKKIVMMLFEQFIKEADYEDFEGVSFKLHDN